MKLTDIKAHKGHTKMMLKNKTIVTMYYTAVSLKGTLFYSMCNMHVNKTIINLQIY
jgi:hypothetical protein